MRFKTFTFLLVLLFANSANAQLVNRVFEFKFGDEFVKETKITSDGIVERGKQSIKIKTESNITKSIKVTDLNETGYSFRITIEDMDNQIESMGLKLHFNSKKPVDPSSKIEKALRYMFEKPVELQTDKNGIILSLQDPTNVLASDTLLAFAGIQPEFFERGDLFTLVGDFELNSKVVKGYTWADSLVIDEQKMVTDYVIEDVNTEKTVIKLKTSIYGRLINTNTNATYIVENKTGIILEKLIYSISTGFRISDNLLYTVSRSSTIVESIKRRNPVEQK